MLGIGSGCTCACLRTSLRPAAVTETCPSSLPVTRLETLSSRRDPGLTWSILPTVTRTKRSLDVRRLLPNALPKAGLSEPEASGFVSVTISVTFFPLYLVNTYEFQHLERGGGKHYPRGGYNYSEKTFFFSSSGKTHNGIWYLACKRVPT